MRQFTRQDTLQKWKYIRIDQIQFGYMPGRGTVDTIFILRQVHEKTLEGNKRHDWASLTLRRPLIEYPGS